MDRLVTTLLDVLGLLLLAAGAYAWLAPLAGRGPGLLAAGAVVLAGSALADAAPGWWARLRRRGGET